MNETPDGPGREPLNAPAVTARMLSSGGRLDQFCELVLGDFSLQDRLRSPDDTEQFIAIAWRRRMIAVFNLLPKTCGRHCFGRPQWVA